MKRGLIIESDIKGDFPSTKLLEIFRKDLQTLFNSLDDFIFILDFEAQILSVNSIVLKRLKYSKEELIGKSALMVHPSELREEAAKLIGEMVNGTREVCSIPLITKDGRLIPVETKVTKGKWGDQDALFGISRDITERQKFETVIKKSEEKYRELYEEAPIAFFSIGIDKKINRYNNAALNLLGYSEEELLHLTVFDLYADTDYGIIKAKDLFNQFIKGEKIKDEELQMRKKNGELLWVSLTVNPVYKYSGEIIESHSIVIDITERKRTEQELKTHVKTLEILNRIITLGNEVTNLYEFLEKSYDQVLDLVDFDRGGIYLYNPKNFHNTLILHKNVHPDFIAAVKNVDISTGLFAKVFNKKSPFHIDDFSEFMKNSKELGVNSAVIVPIRAKDEYIGSMNLGSPVYQKISEEELELLLAIGKQMGIIIQKFETEKLGKESEEKYREAFDQASLYKDIFAHDINNILQNIQSSLELSLLYLNNPEKSSTIKELYGIIKEQVSRGSKLISNVRKLSTLHESLFSLKPVRVNKTLKESIKFLKQSFQTRKLKIQFTPKKKEYFVYANELLLDIFENLLLNAVRHNSNVNVKIEIDVSKEDVEGKKFIKIQFIDNGDGIEDVRKEFIFQRGSKEKSSNGGMGLGLSLVKKTINRYNGKIWVQDRVKGDSTKGSNFILLIPEGL